MDQAGSTYAQETARIRSRIRSIGPSSFPVFVFPLVFFVLSYALAGLQEAEAISSAVHWVVFAALAILAFLGTVRILDRRQLLRRGHRLSAPALVIYLVAVRGALFAQAEVGSGAFLGVFVLTMVVLVIYTRNVRKAERPKPGVSYSDLTTTAPLVPIIVALNEVDRVDQELLGVICESTPKGLKTSVDRLVKAGYVNLVSSPNGAVAVTPTSHLRRAVREYRARNQRSRSNSRPAWLRAKS